MKEPKKTDPFIIKLTKQVDANTKKIADIDKFLEKEIEIPILSLEPLNIPTTKGMIDIHANFTHLATENDQQFLKKFGRDVVGILKAKGVKDFEMKFKK